MKNLKKALTLVLAMLIAMNCFGLVSAAEPGDGATQEANWVSTWATSEEKCDTTSTAMPKSALNGTTVRQIFRPTTSGEHMKLTFSNQYGQSDVVVRSLHIAKQVQADKSTIDTATDTVVTVGGQEEFTIPAGKTIETDAVAFPITALENIAVSMFFGTAPTANITGHRGARATTYQISGNNVSTENFAAGSTNTTTSWFFLCDVAIDMPAGSKAIVCFGDSITDGYGTDASYLGKRPDSYTRWGDYFAKRLQANDATKTVSVLNEGIGANAMFGAYPTDAGKDRFARDLLEHDGVAYLIILFGVNDLQKLSNTDKAAQLIAEYEKMVKLAHDNDILVYAAPILPFGTSKDYYSAASEQVRTIINDWFRSPESGVDAIIDFESAVADPANPINLLEKYTHTDGLHPYDGYSAMADAIDLTLFSTEGPCDHEYIPVITAPTCLEDGYTTYTCSKCDSVRKGDAVPALGHSWDEGTITTAPTETTPGIMTYACTRCDATKTKRIPRIGATVPDDIDFTDAASADRFEVVNKDVTAIRPGEGLYLITTKDGFEPANDQLTGTAATTPKDLVLIPVEGDWAATMKFDFNQASAANGYYQFFGFYAMADYDNCAGIRGGDGAMQDFLRKSGAVSAETMNSQPGLAANGTYWYRLIKEGTTYTCQRSADGEEFTTMFTYADTGIEAEQIAVDAYTGMTAGYEFLLKSMTFEDVGGAPQPHNHSYTAIVTAPTCTTAGYTVFTCSCGASYVDDEVEALGHSMNETTVDATCTEAGSVTNACALCDYKEVTSIPALGHDVKEETVPATCTTAGSLTKTCSRCDFKEVTAIPALGHDVKEATVPATCTTAGSVTKTCSRCDFKEVTEIAALGHDFKDGVCTVCGEKEETKPCDGGVACPSKAYTDVPAVTNWAHEGIDYCVKNGLMNGTSATLFTPAGTLTRGQLVTILYRMAGEPEVTFKTIFTDVVEGKYFSKAVVWASENKIVNGYTDNTFKPNDKITREQIATILYRYEQSPKVTGSLSFPDSASVSAYAKDAMLWATQNGLITGVKSGDVTNLMPKANATRAQIAAIIMRFLQAK